MADTLVTTFKKVRFTENVKTRGQVDQQDFAFLDYSSSDVNVGAGDTLTMQLLSIPADFVTKNVNVKVVTANGAALTGTIVNAAGTAVHSGTFDLNAAGNQVKAALVAYDSEDTWSLRFPNSAAIKTVLEVVVSVEGFYTDWRNA